MPRGDGTGPGGCGPMSGRGMGYCAGYPNAGSAGNGFGFGRGGGGRGWRHRFFATGAPGWQRAAAPVQPDAAARRQMLEARRADLAAQLADVEAALGASQEG